MRRWLTTCPACDGSLSPTRFRCSECSVVIEGDFRPHPIAMLPENDLEFIMTFLGARGNIREVERVMKISYPTVRGRLNRVLAKLGLSTEELEPSVDVSAVLDKLHAGKIGVDEAIGIIHGEMPEEFDETDNNMEKIS